MSIIGIVDDRDDVRTIMLDTVELALSDGWEAIAIPPLSSLDSYPSWISQEEIVVLLIDERLNEVANVNGAVDYEGHDLVDYMRQHMPEFPIFVVTSYKENAPDLDERFKDVEDITLSSLILKPLLRIQAPKTGRLPPSTPKVAKYVFV